MFFKKQKGNNIFLVCGLGNPEPKYDGTRHNAGFEAIDCLAEKLGVKFNKNKFSALYGETEIGGNRVILAKPQTYMNSSGISVGGIAKIKFGVGDNPHPDYDMLDWVLGKMEKELLPLYSEAKQKTALAAEEIIKTDIEKAMNKFNG